MWLLALLLFEVLAGLKALAGTEPGVPAQNPSHSTSMPALSGLFSPRAALLDRSNGEIIAGQAMQEKAPPASLTKIMTVLLAAESLPDLDAPVTLEDGIFPPLWQANASLAGFAAGETVPVRDLLYGALLPSGAECSVTLACCAAGDEQTFVQRMNQRAAALGMQDTHF